MSSPTPAVFTDESAEDETFLESDRSCLFELIAEAVTAAGEGKVEVYSRPVGLFLCYSRSSRKHFNWMKN